MVARRVGEASPRRLTAIDWHMPLEDKWFELSATIRWAAGRPRAHLDLLVWDALRPAGVRKTSVWAEPLQTRPSIPYNGLKGIVNVINEAERDYWVEYLRYNRR